MCNLLGVVYIGSGNRIPPPFALIGSVGLLVWAVHNITAFNLETCWEMWGIAKNRIKSQMDPFLLLLPCLMLSMSNTLHLYGYIPSVLCRIDSNTIYHPFFQGRLRVRPNGPIVDGKSNLICSFWQTCVAMDCAIDTLLSSSYEKCVDVPNIVLLPTLINPANEKVCLCWPGMAA